MDHSVKDIPGNHKPISYELSKIVPVDFPNKAGDSGCKFLTKVFPVNSCNQKIQRIYNRVDTGTNGPPHQIPVNMIYQTVKCSGKCIAEFRYLRTNLFPADSIIDFLKSFIYSTGNISSKTFPVFRFNELLDFIRNSFNTICNRDRFKHLSRCRCFVSTGIICSCTPTG